MRPSLFLMRYGRFGIHVMHGVGDERVRFEKELLERGVHLPLTSRTEWARYRGEERSWFVAVTEEGGSCLAGFALEPGRSRSLPGTIILRAPHFGSCLSGETLNAAVYALTRLAQHDWRILRVVTELYMPDDHERERVGHAFEAAQFTCAPAPRMYRDTLAVALSMSDEEHLAALPSKTRRDIRVVTSGRRPVRIAPVHDAVFAERLDELLRESMDRTGGLPQAPDWRGVMDLSKRAPHLSRLVGLFRTDMEGPESLLAFAWGCHHGAYAHYDQGASTRSTDLKIPLTYALLWDIICWARANGATWFDLGGVSTASANGEDPLAGISSFKRYFSRTVVRVGEDWVYEPRQLYSRLAKTSRRIGRFLFARSS